MQAAAEWVPIDAIHPWAGNPRVNDDAVDKVVRSIQRWGWGNPILARKANHEIIAGHTRFKAAQKMKLDRVCVRFLDLDEEQSHQLAIADNRLGEEAEWDTKSLAKLLEGIRIEDPGAIVDIGFDEQELADLAAEMIEIPGEGEGDEDEIPDPPEMTRCKPGDLWILGKHRLLCGDSASASAVDRLVAGAPIHMVNTDPPYNVAVQPRGDAFHVVETKEARGRPLENDAMSPEEYAQKLQAWFGNAARVLLPGRGFYIWGGWSNWANYPAALVGAGLNFAQGIVWVKGGPVLSRKDFMLDFECCFYGWREGAAHQFFGAPGCSTDVWTVKKVSAKAKIHLTEKPVALAERAIGFSSRAGENVLDLFAGSGSTLIAAEKSGRRAFLMELDARYADVILERWEKYTGKKAERAEWDVVEDQDDGDEGQGGSVPGE